MRIILATSNAGKLAEYERLLAGVPDVELESLESLAGLVHVVEDGDTFHANALKKARAVAAVTGVPSMADDSGLEVDALGGRPGVHSARYAGTDATAAQNNEKLLQELSGVRGDERTARFRCAIVLVDGKGRELLVAEGACEGRIAASPRGTHGFGYDPLFIAHGHQQTMAELLPEKKNQISHRAKAATKLVAGLRELQKP
ncbi:MAG: XTP/dITP diphosphatase [Myxococcales bacterium]|nr:XTP/dITP diphosphatase [Myxococcales bacterium]MDH3483349.1 XTP/dITP diphosphatase [Myxococcales bacterium]